MYKSIKKRKKIMLYRNHIILAIIIIAIIIIKGISSNKEEQAEFIFPKDNDLNIENTAEPTEDTLNEEKNNNTVLFLIKSTSELDISGLYSGTYSHQDGFIEIDYKDSTILLKSENALPILSAKILPIGVISQKGNSACGAACLYMIVKNLQLTDNRFITYDSLLNFSENYGYNNQGSLFSDNGGMDSVMLEKLANEAYSISLVNKYSNTEKPSDTIRDIIDNNKQAIVLVQSHYGNIVRENGFSHFIVVTGYEESNGKLIFLYADSNYYDNGSESSAIRYIQSDLLNESAASYFDEPNAILCIAD